MTDYNVESELRQNLNSDEKLLWAGRPKTGIIFKASDIYFIPFSLFWSGFIVFWEKSVINISAPLFFKLFGIPFFIAGLYITIIRFFVSAKLRANTIYGITEDRVIIKSGIFSRSIKSINIKATPNISYNQKADGSGTIVFGNTGLRYTTMQGMEWAGGARQPTKLEYIDDVKTVYDKIIDLQRKKSSCPV